MVTLGAQPSFSCDEQPDACEVFGALASEMSLFAAIVANPRLALHRVESPLVVILLPVFILLIRIEPSLCQSEGS